MTSIKAVLRKKQNKQGLYPLSIRITAKRKTTYIYTGQYLDIDYWDEKNAKVKKGHPNAMRLNHFILNKMSEVNEKLLELTVKSKSFSARDLKEAIDSDKNTATVFQRCDLFFEDLLKAKKFNRYSGEKAAITHLKRFRKQKDLQFEELTIALLRQFRTYLIGTVGVSSSSTVNYFITIRSIYNRAITDGIVTQAYYPFGKGGIKLKRGESLKVGLIEEEVKGIENIELDKDSYIHHARNMWLISFYFAGLRAGDLLLLRWSDFHDGRLYYTMNKNEKSDSVKVSEKAQRILDKYKHLKHEHDLVFPDLSLVKDINDRIEVEQAIKYRGRKLNNALAKIATLLELKKPLTNHIARHSFATIAGDKIPIQRLQQLYRHSSITTTINYQKAFLNKGTDDALDKVLDF